MQGGEEACAGAGGCIFPERMDPLRHWDELASYIGCMHKCAKQCRLRRQHARTHTRRHTECECKLVIMSRMVMNCKLPPRRQQ
eukprot:365167-Chlamydomonas_euryale.AAC.2